MKTIPTAMLVCICVLFGITQRSTRSEATPNPLCPGSVRAIVLSGGGTKGAYQAGAIWYLVNIAGCDFKHFYGTSTGAVTAALLSQASGKDELKDLVKQLIDNYKSLEDASNLVQGHSLGLFRLFLLPSWLGGVDGIYKLEPLARLLRDQINPDRIKGLTMIGTSLQSGVIYAMIGPEFDDISPPLAPYDPIEFILGSASLPLIVQPRRVRFWVDAAIRERNYSLEKARLRR